MAIQKTFDETLCRPTISVLHQQLIEGLSTRAVEIGFHGLSDNIGADRLSLCPRRPTLNSYIPCRAVRIRGALAYRQVAHVSSASIDCRAVFVAPTDVDTTAASRYPGGPLSASRKTRAPTCRTVNYAVWFVTKRNPCRIWVGE